MSAPARGAVAGADYRLAASAEMLFLDLPVTERVRALDAAGFVVEIWDWTTKDVEALAATGAEFSSMTGYVTGSLTDPAGIAELLESAELSLAVAHQLDCAGLNLHGTGLDGDGLPVVPVHEVTGTMWLTALRTLEQVAALGESHGRVFTLENLNLPVDHPGTPFARAADTLALVAAVGSPHLRMNLDLYHAQIGEGDLVQLLRRALPHVGEIQVADVPGRCEPGTGGIAYRRIARELRDLGYAGIVGLEGWASAGPEEALAAFREAFTP